MKRFLIVMITVLALLGGCGSRERPRAVAVLENAEINSAVVVFIGKNNRELFAKVIDFPADVYFGDNELCYSLDNADYYAISYDSYRSSESLSGIEGYLMYHDPDLCTVIFNQGQMQFFRNAEKVQEFLWGETAMFRVEDALLYMISQGTMNIYDLKSCELLYQTYVGESIYNELVKIDGNIYWVSDNGYSLIRDGVVEATYIYPRYFEAIESSVENRLMVVEEGEISLYDVSFDKYKMVLVPDYDEDYFNPMEFEKVFAKWYEKGYEVAYYQVY